MKKTVLGLFTIIAMTITTYSLENVCHKKSQRFTKACVEDLAQRCDKDWQDALIHGGDCLEFAMRYDEDKRYKEMAMVAYKRALLLPKYESGGAYMSTYPIVDMNFEEEVEHVRFKSLDDIHAKRLTKSELEKYVCGNEKGKACKSKMGVYLSLSENIFSGTYHPYYSKHPDKDRLSKKEQKMLMQEHIKKHIKKSDLKWVKVLQEEGKVSR